MAGGGAGQPVGLVGFAGCGWRSEFAVYREGRLEGDEGLSVLDKVGEGVVQLSGRSFECSYEDFDACRAKFGDALAAYLGVGVLGGDDAACDTGGDEGVGAGAGAALVAAGFERDVGGGSGGADATLGGLLESDDLGVVAVVVDMRAFTNDLGGASPGRCAGEDATYLRIWRCQADSLGGERQGSLHEEFVLRVCTFHHGSRIAGSERDYSWRIPPTPYILAQSLQNKMFKLVPR